MLEELRRLRNLITSRPRLQPSEGALIVMSQTKSGGEHAIQFADDSEALFFYACVNNLPGILDELEARRASDRDAELEATRLEAATYYETIGELDLKLRSTAELLRLETAKRTQAQGRARKLALALLRK